MIIFNYSVLNLENKVTKNCLQLVNQIIKGGLFNT